jgi:hypothetical protein
MPPSFPADEITIRSNRSKQKMTRQEHAKQALFEVGKFVASIVRKPFFAARGRTGLPLYQPYPELPATFGTATQTVTRTAKIIPFPTPQAAPINPSSPFNA